MLPRVVAQAVAHVLEASACTPPGYQRRQPKGRAQASTAGVAPLERQASSLVRGPILRVACWVHERRPPFRDRYDAMVRHGQDLQLVVEVRELAPTAGRA